MLGLSTVLPSDPFKLVIVSLCVIGLFLATIFFVASKPKAGEQTTLQAYLKFFYACFVKPHSGDGTGNQQDALVSLFITRFETVI